MRLLVIHNLSRPIPPSPSANSTAKPAHNNHGVAETSSAALSTTFLSTLSVHALVPTLGVGLSHSIPKIGVHFDQKGKTSNSSIELLYNSANACDPLPSPTTRLSAKEHYIISKFASFPNAVGEFKNNGARSHAVAGKAPFILAIAQPSEHIPTFSTQDGSLADSS